MKNNMTGYRNPLLTKEYWISFIKSFTKLYSWIYIVFFMIIYILISIPLSTIISNINFNTSAMDITAIDQIGSIDWGIIPTMILGYFPTLTVAFEDTGGWMAYLSKLDDLRLYLPVMLFVLQPIVSSLILRHRLQRRNISTPDIFGHLLKANICTVILLYILSLFSDFGSLSVDSMSILFHGIPLSIIISFLFVWRDETMRFTRYDSIILYCLSVIKIVLFLTILFALGLFLVNTNIITALLFCGNIGIYFMFFITGGGLLFDIPKEAYQIIGSNSYMLLDTSVIAYVIAILIFQILFTFRLPKLKNEFPTMNTLLFSSIVSFILTILMYGIMYVSRIEVTYLYSMKIEAMLISFFIIFIVSFISCYIHLLISKKNFM
ncbi:MAG: hypothetical protein ACK5LC_07615 [Coprobacillaceae bacterium]